MQLSCRTSLAVRAGGARLQYQLRHPQGKLVRVVTGEVCESGRPASQSPPSGLGCVRPTAGTTTDDVGAARIAQGLCVSEGRFPYKTTDYYHPNTRTLLWNDPAVGVQWPWTGEPLLAAKDAAGAKLVDSEVFA